MPLSFGLLVGLLAVVIGVVLYAVTGQKKAAVALVGVGAAVALLTLAALVLAVGSRM